MSVVSVTAKPIHDVINDIKEMCLMWIEGEDVAIPYMVGPPGTAKTSLALKLIEEEDWNCVHSHFSLKPIESISGMPDFKDVTINNVNYKGTIWRLPDILTKIYEVALAEPEKPCIWILDDFHLGSPGHYYLAYEMFSQDRSLHTYEIPKNVAFLLAGNEGSKAGARTIFSAVINRIARFPITMDFNFWKEEYAVIKDVNSKVVSFLSNNNYQRWFIGEEQTGDTWPSPRSWTRFAHWLTRQERNGVVLDHDRIAYMCAAHVGGPAAADFASYHMIYSKILMDQIFDGRIPIEIPSDMLNRYIYMIAATLELTHRASGKSKEKDITKPLKVYCDIVGQMASTASEIAVVGLKEVVLLGKALGMTKLYRTVMDTLRANVPASIVNKLVADISQL